jgi:hypothetical protein
MTNEELDQARADEAKRLCHPYVSVIKTAARLAREGWTPPVPVDPDLAEADRLYEAMDWPIGVKGDTPQCYTAFIREGIKRGRELERQEAKPQMVWKKWDGSPRKPINVCNYVWVKNKQGTRISYAKDVAWSSVTHYAIITQPEEAA